MPAKPSPKPTTKVSCNVIVATSSSDSQLIASAITAASFS